MDYNCISVNSDGKEDEMRKRRRQVIKTRRTRRKEGEKNKKEII